MTRIIAGNAGGLSLRVPGAGTRPTSDRVRESLFGSLESGGLVADAHVLDLYAGSGALGLESASRGARSVDLVEHNRGAAACASQNARSVAKVTGVSARVHTTTVEQFLRSSTAPQWDLVFLDPPYDLDEESLTRVLILLAPLLRTDADVIVERSSRSPAPDVAGTSLAATQDRTYGDTRVWWFRAQEPASAQS